MILSALTSALTDSLYADRELELLVPELIENIKLNLRTKVKIIVPPKPHLGFSNSRCDNVDPNLHITQCSKIPIFLNDFLYNLNLVNPVLQSRQLHNSAY